MLNDTHMSAHVCIPTALPISRKQNVVGSTQGGRERGRREGGGGREGGSEGGRENNLFVGTTIESWDCVGWFQVTTTGLRHL